MPEPSQTDCTGSDDLLRRLRSSDESILVEVALRFRAPFLAACRRSPGRFLGELDLEEAFHEALAELWEHRMRLDPDRGSVRGYLFGIMQNLVRRRLRQEMQERERREIGLDVASLAAAPPPAPHSSPVLQQVQASMEQLEEPYRTILVLDAWCYPEVAASTTVTQITELPRRQVSVYRARAREKLRRLLTQEGVQVPPVAPSTSPPS